VGGEQAEVGEPVHDAVYGIADQAVDLTAPVA
jgi:hypothetical protein